MELDSMGLGLDGITIRLDIYTNLTEYDSLSAYAGITVDIEAINLLANLSEENAAQQGVNPGINILSPEWFKNSHLALEIIIKEGFMYESFSSKMNEMNTPISAILTMAGGMVPDEGKDIFNALVPLLQEHKEVQESAVSEDMFNKANDILSMIQYLPMIISEKTINESVFDIKLVGNELSISDINLKNAFPMLETILPIIKIDNELLEMLIDGNFDISLVTQDNKFDTLSVDALFGEYNVSIQLKNHDISFPEYPNFDEFEEVEEITLIKTIEKFLNI